MNVVLDDRTAETVAIYFQKANRPEIRRTLPQKAQTLEEALADFEQTQRPGAASFGRTIWADGEYVGDIWCYGLNREDTPNAMVSYCVFEPEHWGQGIASAALSLFLAEVRERFAWIQTLGAFTFSANAASIQVLKRNGFRLMERFAEDGIQSEYYQV